MNLPAAPVLFDEICYLLRYFSATQATKTQTISVIREDRLRSVALVCFSVDTNSGEWQC